MNIELSNEEHALVMMLVARELSELGPEIRHTDVRAYREDLKEERQVLSILLERLRQPQTV